MKNTYSDFWKKTISGRHCTFDGSNSALEKSLAKYNVGFHIVKDGDIPIPDFADAPVYSSQYWCMRHILSGKGKYLTPEMCRPATLHTGHVIITAPGVQLICGGIPNENYREDRILFAGNVFTKMMAYNLLISSCYYNFNLRFIPNIEELLMRKTPEAVLRTSLKLQEIIMQLKTKRSGSQSLSARFESLLVELSVNPTRWWSIIDMTSYCNCTYRQLRQLFIQKKGVLPKEYLVRVKINFAAKLLLQSNSSIGDICKSMDFRDRSHFSRIFRTIIGCSPRQFQKNFIKDPTADFCNSVCLHLMPER